MFNVYVYVCVMCVFKYLYINNMASRINVLFFCRVSRKRKSFVDFPVSPCLHPPENTSALGPLQKHNHISAVT